MSSILKRKNNMKYLIGIQPTGRLHIGNYLGCIKKGLELQKEGHEVIWLVADLHAMTKIDNSEILELVDNILQDLEKICVKYIWQQGLIHRPILELYWELTCITPLAELQRMTQYKDKKDQITNAGLLMYPVLMAADILYFEPDYVIVGEDQLQHIELTRLLARKTGRKEPEALLTSTPRIMSLVEPSKKMSKSLGDKHVLYLFEEDYEAKLKKAITTEEGIKNLQVIGDALGVERMDKFSAYKHNIAERMKELFL